MTFRKKRLHTFLKSILEKAVGATERVIERTGRSRCMKKGSLTVEAALAVPLFIGAVLLLCGLFSTLEVYEEIDHCLCMTVRQMAACSTGEHPGTADAYRLFFLESGSSNIHFDRIKGSMAGIRLHAEEDGDNLISLHASCRVRVNGYFLPGKGIRIEDTVYARRFTGSEYFSNDSHEKEEHVRVTVAENGKVYHKDSSCSYLKLSVRKTDYKAVSSLRNAYGQKYTPCEKCSRGRRGSAVFITDTGTSWHCNINCSGISRYFYTMNEEEAEAKGYRPCSRCGG